MWYLLNDAKEPVLCEDMDRLGAWMKKPKNRVVGSTVVGGLLVSTVFLGLDHGEDGELVLFETVVFANKTSSSMLGGRPFEYRESFDTLTIRYSTYADALAGHQEAVERIKSLSLMDQELLLSPT